MPGFETRDMKGKFSLRASVTSELILQDVKVLAVDQTLEEGNRGDPELVSVVTLEVVPRDAQKLIDRFVELAGMKKLHAFLGCFPALRLCVVHDRPQLRLP